MITWPDFLFLRHGETALNPTGIDQARAAADVLTRQRIDRIVSSPLIRALRTAAIVSERIAVPVDIASQLSERGFGHLEGKVVNDVKRAIGISPDVPMAAHLPADAQQWPDTVAGTEAAIEAWLTRHRGERILFVAHRGLFAALTEILIGTRREGDNGVPYRFQRQDAVWSVTETV